MATARARITDVVNLFATPLKASHYVELVNPLWSSHKLQARVGGVWDETRDARTITLRPGRNWRRASRGSARPSRACRSADDDSPGPTPSRRRPERRDGCITVTVKVLDGGRMSGHLVRDLRGRHATSRSGCPRVTSSSPRRRRSAHCSSPRAAASPRDEHAADVGHRRQHARRRPHPLRACTATTSSSAPRWKSSPAVGIATATRRC